MARDQIYERTRFRRASRRRSRGGGGARVLLAGILFLSFIGLMLWGGWSLMQSFLSSEEPPPNVVSPDTSTVPEESGGKNLVVPTDLEDLQPGDVCTDGFFLNLVRHDFPDFSSPDEADEEHVLSFGIWQALFDGAQMTLRDSGEALLPQAAADAAAAVYFTRTAPLSHRTTELYGLFEYSAEEQAYVLPIFGIEEYYLPRVLENKRDESGRLVLTVEYVSAMDQDAYQSGGPAPEAKKTAVITLTGENGEYKIESLKSGG